MPLFEYQCQKCGHRTERIEKFEGPKLQKCPKCGGRVERMVSAPAIQFKGSGWYVNDYGKGSGSAGKDAGSSESSKSDGDSKDKSKDKAEAKSEVARPR